MTECIHVGCHRQQLGMSKRCAVHKREHAVRMHLAARVRAKARAAAKLEAAIKLCRDNGYTVTKSTQPEAFPS